MKLSSSITYWGSRAPFFFLTSDSPALVSSSLVVDVAVDVADVVNSFFGWTSSLSAAFSSFFVGLFDLLTFLFYLVGDPGSAAFFAFVAPDYSSS